MTDQFDRAQAIELEEWERNQQRRLPDSQQWQLLSAITCLGCGLRIPDNRREAVPGVQLCVACQQDAEHHQSQRWNRT